MANEDRPKIKLELGISAASKPSIRILRKRARSRARLVAAGQKDLMFLVEGDFTEVAPLLIEDNFYVIEGTIPRTSQARVDEGESASLTQRDDEQDARDVKVTLTAVTASSELLTELGHLMANSQNVIEDIRRLEQQRGVDTSGMRTFLLKQQELFHVTVDGETVPFRGQEVPRVAVVGEPLQVVLTALPPRRGNRMLQGKVEASQCDGRQHGVQMGGVRDFRFGPLLPWQAALIELANQKGQQVVVTVAELKSTGSLKSLPAQVVAVHNWEALLRLGLQEFQQAANDLTCGAAPQPREDAA